MKSIDYTTYEFWDGKQWVFRHVWGSIITGSTPLITKNIQYWTLEK